MRFLSVCAGIETASLAWAALGWRALAFAEIDRFACALLTQRWPSVPNWGDMRLWEQWSDATFDLLAGGTPCQSFSNSGGRRGMADARGNLSLVFCAIAARYRPRWLVWENVPGVLSSDGGRAFGAVLHALGQCGYGFAWRVLDAQYFGVPQRRRRVFLVGHLGDWHPACAVLFDRQSTQGHAAPGGGAQQETSPPLLAAGHSNNPIDEPLALCGQRLRRLTPREWERLQGIPDDYTAITYRGKPASDRVRYRAIGNAWAVPVPAWIGARIAQVHPLVQSAQPAHLASAQGPVFALAPRPVPVTPDLF